MTRRLFALAAGAFYGLTLANARPPSATANAPAFIFLVLVLVVVAYLAGRSVTWHRHQLRMSAAIVEARAAAAAEAREHARRVEVIDQRRDPGPVLRLVEPDEYDAQSLMLDETGYLMPPDAAVEVARELYGDQLETDT